MIEPLLVIPVRGGSIGIPRKALRPLGGIPPLLRTIRMLQPLGNIVVTTDDGEVAALANAEGVSVLHESASFNPRGEQTLDGAVWAAVQASPPSDLVATVQCTSPFLSRETVQRCLYLAASNACDTALTVRDARHVAWTGSLDAPELATPWAVRQSLPERWVITGGCVATKRPFVTPNRRFGGRLQLVEVQGIEAVDLNGPEDWAVAEWYSGAPSLREALLGQVLADAYPSQGLAIKFSAWDEESDDTAFRDALFQRLARDCDILAPLGANTYAECQQTGLVIAMGRDRVHDVLLLTSAYHQVRTFLTMLRVFQEHDLDRRVRLWNVPAASRMDKLPDEWRKITEYQAKGHVASLEDGLAYLDWRDSMAGVLSAR